LYRTTSHASQATGYTTIGEQKAKNKHVKIGTTREEFTKWRSDRDKVLGAPRLLFPAVQVCRQFITSFRTFLFPKVNIRAGKMPTPEANGSVFFKIPVKLNNLLRLVKM
jgi:hypothetical protein